MTSIGAKPAIHAPSGTNTLAIDEDLIVFRHRAQRDKRRLGTEARGRIHRAAQPVAPPRRRRLPRQADLLPDTVVEVRLGVLRPVVGAPAPLAAEVDPRRVLRLGGAKHKPEDQGDLVHADLRTVTPVMSSFWPQALAASAISTVRISALIRFVLHTARLGAIKWKSWTRSYANSLATKKLTRPMRSETGA